MHLMAEKDAWAVLDKELRDLGFMRARGRGRGRRKDAEFARVRQRAVQAYEVWKGIVSTPKLSPKNTAQPISTLVGTINNARIPLATAHSYLGTLSRQAQGLLNVELGLLHAAAVLHKTPHRLEVVVCAGGCFDISMDGMLAREEVPSSELLPALEAVAAKWLLYCCAKAWGAKGGKR